MQLICRDPDTGLFEASERAYPGKAAPAIAAIRVTAGATVANLAPQQKRVYLFGDCLEQYELWIFACTALGECMGLAALAYTSSWYVHIMHRMW
jgi:hypothetical protein